jgi:nucleoside-diphosphate-sugar epimerase
MNVLLTGSTGYIGSAVLRALLARGHDVLAAVRSERSAEAARVAGAEPVLVDLTDVPRVAALLRSVDGAIHLAASDEDAARLDDSVIDAVVESFGGTPKPYVHTSGVWLWGAGADLTEDAPFAPPALVRWRLGTEARLLASDVRTSVVAPGLVYGRGGGIPAGVVADGKRDDDGALLLVGDGEQHWTTVHVDDLADLYVLVLESAQPGGYYLGVNGHNPTAREIAEAVSARVAPEPAEASRQRLGTAFADALLLDQQASGVKARALGWRPTRPSVLDELAGA